MARIILPLVVFIMAFSYTALARAGVGSNRPVNDRPVMDRFYGKNISPGADLGAG